MDVILQHLPCLSKTKQNAQEDSKSPSSNQAFAQWGMDLVGPLSGVNVVCYLMVMTEYLIKWTEVYIPYLIKKQL